MAFRRQARAFVDDKAAAGEQARRRGAARMQAAGGGGVRGWGCGVKCGPGARGCARRRTHKGTGGGGSQGDSERDVERDSDGVRGQGDERRQPLSAIAEDRRARKVTRMAGGRAGRAAEHHRGGPGRHRGALRHGRPPAHHARAHWPRQDRRPGFAGGTPHTDLFRVAATRGSRASETRTALSSKGAVFLPSKSALLDGAQGQRPVERSSRGMRRSLSPRPQGASRVSEVSLGGGDQGRPRRRRCRRTPRLRTKPLYGSKCAAL